MPELERYSMGIGDRFGQEGPAQLRAFVLAREAGVRVTPVWNKSHREHTLIGSAPADVRREADEAVRRLRWEGAYFVDADHVGLATVDAFAEACDFFTLDVAHQIGQPVDPARVRQWVDAHRALVEEWPSRLPGLPSPTTDTTAEIVSRYLAAVEEAGRVYRRVRALRGGRAFLVELSLDEAPEPQSPTELFLILAATADEGVPLQTVAPRFPGRFNKGVDYEGDLPAFARAFRHYVAVVQAAAQRFALLSTLKLSLHSGSDKFSLYPPVRDILRETGAGLHLKTAGTTWLEEVRGLTLAGREGWRLVRDLYRGAWERCAELCAPYATVIAVDPARLPHPDEVDRWPAEQFADALAHDPANPAFRPDLRQLVHVGYRVAADMGPRFRRALEDFSDRIAPGVTANLWERHLRPLFG